MFDGPSPQDTIVAISRWKSRLEESVHALHTLHLQVSRIEEVLLEVQWSISSQSCLLAEIREAQVSSQKATAGSVSVAASAPQSSRSILKKQVRTEEQVEFIPTPPNSPQLPILPGEVKEVRVETSTGDLEAARKIDSLLSTRMFWKVLRVLYHFVPAPMIVAQGDNKTQRSSSRRGARGRDREGRRDVGSSSTMHGTMHVGTSDELSNIFARELLAQLFQQLLQGPSR